ncbi:MAG: TolC family protein [Candidatus Aminicenantes bacterium]|nr:TolC family protein [Candidatus Aminicenantes bacterium]
MIKMARKLNIPAGLAIVFLMALALLAQETGPREISLSLDEAIYRALKHNLNLVAEVYTTEKASGSIAVAKEIFLPSLEMSYGSNRTVQPSTWWIQGSGTYITSSQNYETRLSQRLPIGGTFSVAMSNYSTNTNQLFQLFNPYYNTQLRFDFTQPLLKNFGPRVAKREIIVARQNYAISEAQLKNQVMETIYQVEEAYWNLVLARENLKVKQQSLQLARDQLAKTRKEIEVGQQASIEILNVQAAVSQREAEIVQAEASVRTAEDRLKVILNLASGTDLATVHLIPSEKPEFKPVKIDLKEALQTALFKRPDLQIDNLTIESKRYDYDLARNQLLPQLDLNISYWSPGISGDRLLYRDDNPWTGEVVGKIPGSLWDSFRDASRFLYNNWSVNFTLTIPLADFISRSKLALAQTELAEAQAKQKAREQQAMLEVSEAVNNIETLAKSVEAYRVAREYAEKLLEAETKKLAVGLTTNFFVLDAQEKLAAARSAELKALIDYNLAQARLEKVIGTILENRKVSLGQVGQK